MLKKKSEELAKKLGHDDFKATDGADVVGAEEWKSKKVPELLQKFCADDIYRADETGLFYRAMPDGSLC
jgi:hypothetical protein